MSYSLSSAPSAFQEIISSVLSGIDGCINLLEDIVIHGRTKDQHDTRLQLVLDRLAEYHITLNPYKCQFAKTEINFLGYHVSPQGVLPLYSDVKTIMELPQPTSAKEVASFLGTTNVYLKFVPHHADTAEPLRRLLRKDVPWEWTYEQDEAFRTHHICSNSCTLRPRRSNDRDDRRIWNSHWRGIIASVRWQRTPSRICFEEAASI